MHMHGHMHACIMHMHMHGHMPAAHVHAMRMCIQASLAAKLMLGSTVLSARSRYPLWFEPLLRHQVQSCVSRRVSE